MKSADTINPFRIKTWAILSLIALSILALPFLPHFWVKVVFTSFFILWAVIFYFKKVLLKNELVTDGVWWIPYFLVAGLGILVFTENYHVLLSDSSWENLIKSSFVVDICAILFFWEWPPWLDKNKVLISRGKRIFLAYVFFVLGLAVWLYGGMCLSNIVCDRSRPVVHDCRITDLLTMGHRYAEDTQYMVFIKPWRDDMKSYSFFVTHQDYQRINLKSTIVRVWTKEGYWHLEWVAGVKPLNL